MRTRASWLACLLVAPGVACSDVSIAPSVPATLELAKLTAAAVGIGDTLRDANGVASPLQVIVRNQQGDVLPNAAVRFVYADANKDSAVFVDSITGYVVSLGPLPVNRNTARIAARVGPNLQVIRTVLVAIRPDSVDHTGSLTLDTLRTTLTDTAATANTSGALSVTVRHFEGTVGSLVSNWLVKYELLHPANPTNDSTASVFLVNDLHRVSNIDTTDASGIASRFVRVRASQFPASAAPDSAVVRVTVWYKGQPLHGAPLRLVVPVIKKQ